ncbi:hypothetical protein CYMTET_40255 [Cymbomonas tetramitiformis]|uniref:BTB domain-containing protein n=1 Tax=Cymbomonas tetramitiformis TaxID=36881 RepID=A0AAE0F3P3_9CHLO|nr:hypothetical protein CYMTET_40255 [Cymbomonas tetramitiformis]
MQVHKRPRACGPSTPSDDTVVVDVGGREFKTRRATLGLSEYFANVFKYDAEPSATQSHVVSVDRSPEPFPHVLDWLRTKTIDHVARRELRQRLASEADFYGIPSLKCHLFGKIDPMSDIAREADRELRSAETKALLAYDDSPTRCDSSLLIDLFDPAIMETLIKKDSKSLETPIILRHHAIFGQPSSEADGAPKAAIEDELSRSRHPKTLFRQRYNMFTGGIVEALKDHTNKLRGLENRPEQHDVDIFIVGSSPSEARATLKLIVESIMKNAFEEDKTHVLLMRTQSALTIFRGYPLRNVQIVLQCYRTMEEITYDSGIRRCVKGLAALLIISKQSEAAGPQPAAIISMLVPVSHKAKKPAPPAGGEGGEASGGSVDGTGTSSQEEEEEDNGDCSSGRGSLLPYSPCNRSAANMNAALTSRLRGLGYVLPSKSHPQVTRERKKMSCVFTLARVSVQIEDDGEFEYRPSVYRPHIFDTVSIIGRDFQQPSSESSDVTRELGDMVHQERFLLPRYLEFLAAGTPVSLS